MSNSLTVFSSDSTVVYTTKKGDLLATSPEGALFKGGVALSSLKDLALDAALAKANNGRYQAITDILETAFPKVYKAFVALHGVPCQNKAQFASFIGCIENASAGAKGFTKKQIVAQSVVRTLRTCPALRAEADTREVVEMA